MLNPIDFVQLGVAGVSLIVIAVIVERFLKAQKEFLDLIHSQEKNFKETINGHLVESSKVNHDLSSSVRELLTWLRQKNGSK